MAKRSEFERRKNDDYRTWGHRAVKPLLPHLPKGASFIEPCAGGGDLIRLLAPHGIDCVGAFDLHPGDQPYEGRYGSAEIGHGDATRFDVAKAERQPDLFISNPPWTREILHPIILNLFWQRPTWLLFDADWMHTLQARRYLPLCRKVIAVGRLKWIEGSPHDGKDNVCWYGFWPGAGCEFYGR